jgi:pyruvate/2-oxoglutarate dehydrogenase complex dihydrolipoamide dehydrogenase (E3) component
MSEDHEVSEVVVGALAAAGINLVEDAGTLDRFERCATGVRLLHSSGNGQQSIDATVAVVAAGWVAATAGLTLDRAGVQTNLRGYVEVDAQLRTSAPHVFAAGDVTGRAMVVHEAVRQGLVAATNAVLGPNTVVPAQVSPIGSFTDPEYASVGLTETAARQTHDAVVATVRFDSLPRPIIDGRQTGFCKLVIDRELHTILGCHVVGERAVELAQLAATAMAARCRSSSSHWSRFPSPHTRTPWVARQSRQRSSSITPECGSSVISKQQLRPALPELAGKRIVHTAAR